MYYIAFFTGGRDQIFEISTSFSQGKTTNVSIVNDQQRKPFQQLNDIPFHTGCWYPHSWHIHGQSLALFPQQKLIEIPTYTSPQFTTSFKHIDSVLNRLSTEYAWSIFPWGGAKRFSAFGFLSSDNDLYNWFINILSTTKQVDLISLYTVKSSLSDCAHAILLRGYHFPAYRLWEVCSCDIDVPLLITDLRFDDETFSTFEWGSPQYTLSKVFSLNNSQVLSVYQVLNQLSFELMCKLSTQEPETFIWVHSGTNLQELENLLRETEAYDSVSDLGHLQKILGTTEWFYGIDRDRADYGDSLFVARNNLLLNRFDNAILNDGCQLISCF